MENNIYLDKVVEFIVRDTKIDYDKEEIQFPFPLSFPTPFLLLFFLSSLSLSSFPFSFHSFSSSFSKYCIDVYGLTDQEIGYVWNQYKDIITDKIDNE